jgi:hypothetical protein
MIGRGIPLGLHSLLTYASVPLIPRSYQGTSPPTLPNPAGGERRRRSDNVSQWRAAPPVFDIRSWISSQMYHRNE